jgi:nucleotide-binding universal stress UspA family protein
MQVSSIVVAHDGSVLGRRALRRAAQCAAERDARVVVVSVETLFVGTARTSGPRDALDRWNDPRAERAFMRTLFWGKARDWQLVRAKGDPEKAIVAIAKDHDAELIILGAGQPSMLKRLLRQAISENVVAHAHCDVYVVR